MKRVFQSRLLSISVQSKSFQSFLRSKHYKFLDLIKDHGEGSITFVKKGEIGEIIISNPSKRNALSGRMINQLVDIVDNLNEVNDSDILAVILRGQTCNHPTFCSGLDLNLAKTIINTSEIGMKMCHTMTDTLNTLRNAKFLSFAYISGYALGGGAELSTSCDYRIMTNNAIIGFIHITINASPGWGGAHRLYDIIGRNQTLHLLCSGAKIDAKHAYDIKLCDKILHISNEIDGDNAAMYDVTLQELYNYISHTYHIKYHDNTTVTASCANIPHTSSRPSNSIHEMKQMVNGISLNHYNTLISNDILSNDDNVEKKMFARKWGSESNRKSINSK